MPEDVAGTPSPDGGEPDDRDRGGMDEEFASVVFDEAFVRAAVVHEPTAVERLLAAAQADSEAQEAEARRAHTKGARDDEHYEDGFGPDRDCGHGRDLDDLDDTGIFDGRYGAPGAYGRAYGKRVRWRRPVAWVLALVIGVGMVALAFTAVYRGASSGGRQGQVPSPASTGVEQGGGRDPSGPSASADHSQPPVSAVPRTP